MRANLSPISLEFPACERLHKLRRLWAFESGCLADPIGEPRVPPSRSPLCKHPGVVNDSNLWAEEHDDPSSSWISLSGLLRHRSTPWTSLITCQVWMCRRGHKSTT